MQTRKKCEKHRDSCYLLNIISLLNDYSFIAPDQAHCIHERLKGKTVYLTSSREVWLIPVVFWLLKHWRHWGKTWTWPREDDWQFFHPKLWSQIAKMKQKLNIDHVFSHIGEMGPQQIRYLVLMSVMTMYSPQFMIQVNQTRQSFINFWCTFRRKCRSLNTFKSCHLLFWCVRGKLQYFPFILQYNFVGRDDINFTCHLKNGSSLANYCLDGKLSSCNRIDFQTDDADSIVSALSISQ